MDIKEFEELYKIAFPEFSNFIPLPHLAHLEGARWGFLTSKKLLLPRIKELEEEGKRITSFLGKPMEYWIELDVYAKENMYEEMILKICNLEAHIKEIEEIKLEEVEQERERLSKLLVELYKKF